MFRSGRKSYSSFGLLKFLPVVVAAIALVGCSPFASRADIAAEIKSGGVAKRYPNLSPTTAELISKLDDSSVKLLIAHAGNASKSATDDPNDPLLTSETKQGVKDVMNNEKDRKTVSNLDPDHVKATKDEGQKAADAGQKFLGFSLGAGPSISIDRPGKERVESAQAVGGNVHVDKAHNITARVLMETHYNFVIKGTDGKVGIGPFAALASGDGKAVDAIGLGLISGFRVKEDSTAGLCIGVGVLFEPYVKSLASGFKDGQPLPAGETEVRFSERSRTSLLLMIGFSF